MKEWFEDESFWKEFYPYMFPQNRFEAAKNECKKVQLFGDMEGGVYGPNAKRLIAVGRKSF